LSTKRSSFHSFITHCSHFLNSGPHPPLWQLRQYRCVRRDGLLVLAAGGVFALGAEVFLPPAAALGADAFEQEGGGLVGGVALGELATEGGGEDDLAEVGEEIRDGIEGIPSAARLGEEGFDLADDAMLFSEGRQGNW
jgi:hypothetical protein